MPQPGEQQDNLQANGGLEPRERLYADLVNHPAHLIRRSFQIFLACFNESIGDADLTPVQWILMATLYSYPSSDITRLGQLAAVDKASSGRAIALLEKRKLLRIERTVLDQRQKIVSLTEAGEARVLRAAPRVERMKEQLFQALTPTQRDDFMRVMHNFVQKNKGFSRVPHIDGLGGRAPNG